MDRVAVLSFKERSELFQATANDMGVTPHIIEKDFWVCWTLKQLFQLPEVGENLIFKGGTSLSKIFKVIERFSEDIDVSINREYLGCGEENTPQETDSTNEQRRKLEALNLACKQKIENHLLPSLQKVFSSILDSEGSKSGDWQLTQDEADPQTLLFTYPREKDKTEVQAISYIRPVVAIELGARADHWPAEEHPITSYAAERYQTYFEEPSHQIKVLAAERTFWEKATILHAEFFRPQESLTPLRLSRHYYDLYRLAHSKISSRALDNLLLLKHVVDHKKLFFRLPRAQYDDACQGALHLIPQEVRIKDLQNDYEKMKEMFFNDIPSFSDILSKMEELEAEINSKARKQ